MNGPKLKQWLKDKHYTSSLISMRCGVTKSTVSTWLNGHHTPNSSAAIIIEQITSGEIIAEDW